MGEGARVPLWEELIPTPVFCERVRKRLKAKNLEWKTEYTQNGRVRKGMSRKGLDRGICNVLLLKVLSSRLSKSGCAGPAGRRVRAIRNPNLRRMLSQKYRFVKRLFYVLEGQGDKARRAAALCGDPPMARSPRNSPAVFSTAHSPATTGDLRVCFLAPRFWSAMHLSGYARYQDLARRNFPEADFTGVWRVTRGFTNS